MKTVYRFDTIIKFLKNRNTIFIICCVLGMLLEWFQFKGEMGMYYPSFLGTILKGLGDLAIFFVFYWYLRPKWRWVMLLPVYFYSLWCVSNITYLRFWNDFIPPAVVSMADNINKQLFLYAWNLTRLNDIVYIIVPIILTILYFIILPYKNTKFNIRTGIIGMVTCLCIIVIGQISYLKSTIPWFSEYLNLSKRDTIKFYYIERDIYKDAFVRRGYIAYFIQWLGDVIYLLNSSITLSPEEISKIEKQISLYIDNQIDSQDACQKNIIFIIAESLNSEVIEKTINGCQITPTLDSLINKDGTIYIERVIPQVKDGESSDGQRLLLTGILPLNKGAASLLYSSKNRYPSLAKLLPNHEKMVFLADDGVCWHEEEAMQTFGFEDIRNSTFFEKTYEGRGIDDKMFKYAQEEITSLHQPFFVVMVTMTMHFPFKEDDVPLIMELDSANGFNKVQKDYYNSAHTFDSALKEFLSKIPENTIVIIASDHSQNVASKVKDPTGVFIATNTGISKRITDFVGQVNLFPTTLDILNLKNLQYNGLAPSVLSSSIKGSLTPNYVERGSVSELEKANLKEAFEVSDLIIRSNYFCLGK